MARDIIIINRGDTFEFDLTIDDTTSPTGKYQLKGDDAVYFGIMEPHQLFEDAIVKKKYTVDDTSDTNHEVVTIVIDSEDTLDLLNGKYYYTIKAHLDHDETYTTTVDGIDTTVTTHIDKVQTIIDKTKFIILN